VLRPAKLRELIQLEIRLLAEKYDIQDETMQSATEV
jgi:hypothetical protein